VQTGVKVKVADEKEVWQTAKIDKNSGEAVIIRSEEIHAYCIRTCKQVNILNGSDVLIKKSSRLGLKW